MLPRLAWRFLSTPSAGHLLRMGWGLGVGGSLAMLAHRRRLKRGRVFPPVLFISLTSRCNLRCTGCWALPDDPAEAVDLAPAVLERIVRTAKARGNRFFGLLGGEPVLYPHLLDIVRRHSDCCFQLLTNGTLLDGPTVEALARAGNVTPLVSIEGDESVSDLRRGGRGVLSRSLAGLERCVRAGMVTGVASSLCRNNLDALLSEDYLDALIRRGVLYCWYYLYRPVGADPAEELALSAEEVLRVRRFLVEMRTRKPILLIDACWDADGRALCPAAAGISHHVSPSGAAEPCPPIQAAGELLDGPDPARTVEDSAFLAAFRHFASAATPGCVLVEKPHALAHFLDEASAADSSPRGRLHEELSSRDALPGHHQPGREIPEPPGLYRLAKRCWFLGLGSYG